MIHCIIYKNFLKNLSEIKSQNILNSSLLLADKLVISLQKHEGKDVLFCLLQKNISIALHII